MKKRTRMFLFAAAGVQFDLSPEMLRGLVADVMQQMG